MVVRFSVPGEPKGKGRPRVVNAGGYARAYTPEDTLVYENQVKWYYKTAAGQFKFDDKAPLAVEIDAFYQIPKSTSKKKHAEMMDDKVRPTKKPDLDNVAKIVCDALNGIAYHDDSAIVDLRVRKYFNDIPSVNVTIREVNDEVD